MSTPTNLTPNNSQNQNPGNLSRRFWLGSIGVGVLVVAFAAYTLWPHVTSNAALTQKSLRAHNIFALLGDLNGTTDQMLQNTESLHAEVLQVRGKLGELNKQEAIVQQQTQTGQQLATQLTRQEQLTSQDVDLMKQILDREKQSVTLTTTVASQAQQLGDQVGQNASVLSGLNAPLNQASQESSTLNGQLDSLLAELSQSADAFKLFGKLNQLLDPLHLTDSLQKIEDSLLPPAVKDGLKKLLPPLPLLPSSPDAPSSPSAPAPTPGTPSSPLPIPKLPLPIPTPTLPSLPLHL